MTDPTADWFVAAGATGGDGSRGKPFHDLWLALRSAGPGDAVHVAAGTYFGRYDRSSWLVDAPQLTIRGGYSQDFSSRTPWQTPSVLAVLPDHESVRENNILTGGSDHTGLVLDGLFFDAAGRNTYEDEPAGAFRYSPPTGGAIAAFAAGVTIRNCVFANSANGGVELSGEGSRFENNLAVNMMGLGMLTLRLDSAAEPITVSGNAFCFAHDVGPPSGVGGDQAIGIRISGPAVITDNVFVSCGNAAIAVYRDIDRVAIERNRFYLSPRAVLNSRVTGNAGEITESNVGEMEDLGLKSVVGNTVQDPGMTGIPREWLDRYSRNLLADYVTPPRDVANAMRVAAGLPALSPADLEAEHDKGALAPRLDPKDTLALRFDVADGYHPVQLPANVSDGGERSAVTYREIDWSDIDTPDPSLAHQQVELLAALGFEQNVTLLPDTPPETHLGMRIYRPGSDDGSIFVVGRRHTLLQRQFEEASRYTSGREAEITYLVRGLYRIDLDPDQRQKVTIVVQSFAPGRTIAGNRPRPSGRNWFVRAGSSGGDGSRGKPFRDPFQALENAEGGDWIHVAGGDYFGKLSSGKWKILVRDLTLLGGYDAEFNVRDPWAHPTRFLLKEEERAKGTSEGTILESAENSDGLIVDGFVFDGASYNTYTDAGSLDLAASPLAPLVMLRGGQSAITVRNCVIVNGSADGVHITSPAGVFENNVVLNTSGVSLRVRADGPGPWTVREDTVMFACDPTPRAGTGKSTDGTLVDLTGRATAALDHNIIAFADNFGIRVTIPQPNLTFTGNAVAACAYIHLTDAQHLWADASTWDRRAVADSSFARFEGNTLELPVLPVGAGFANAAVGRLSLLPSKISAAEWKRIAAQIGATVAPPAGVADPAPSPSEPGGTALGDASIDGLLASLTSTRDRLEATATPDAAPEAMYCPVFAWNDALALFRDEGTDRGARRLKLSVSFVAEHPRSEVHYTATTPQEIDADHALLAEKAVEVDVTSVRMSQGNSSQLPADLSGDEYSVFSIALAGGAVKTRLALVVRRDTNASRLLTESALNDTIRIRGIARIPLDQSALSILVNTAELI